MRPGGDADPSPPSSAEVKKKSRAIPLPSLRAFVAYDRVKPTNLMTLVCTGINYIHSAGPAWIFQLSICYGSGRPGFGS